MEYGKHGGHRPDVPRAPTLSEAIKEAALATGGKPIHF